MSIPTGQDAVQSDVELLRRDVNYSPPCGFGVTEKWRSGGAQFGVDAAVAKRLCKRFGIDPEERVAR
jgi:hypothetical protein